MVSPQPEPQLRSVAVAFMALAAAIGTSAIYPLQPTIAAVVGALDSHLGAVGLALAMGPVGYMVGLAALVPLVDRYPPRWVIACLFIALALGMAVTSLVGHVVLLGAVVGLVGAFSAVGAALSSLAGRLAPPQWRATTLGFVTAGISVGILAGRTIGGWLADAWGWRGMLLAFGVACALLALGSLAVLPRGPGSSRQSIAETLRGLPGLFVRSRLLRVASCRGALWFFAFCAIWAGLAVALSLPPHAMSAQAIGLYALAGLSGLVATPLAGRWTDRFGARRVILVGLALAVLSAVILALALGNVAVTLVCLAVFDAGLFAAQVANQSMVLSLDPAAPARMNSAYMLVYFVGGSLGTAFGATAVEWGGWPVMVACTVAVLLLAVLLTAGRQASLSAFSVSAGSRPGK